MSYLEKAMQRKAEIDISEEERAKFHKMLMDIKTAADKLEPVPTLKQLKDFLAAVAEVLKSLKEAAK